MMNKNGHQIKENRLITSAKHAEAAIKIMLDGIFLNNLKDSMDDLFRQIHDPEFNKILDQYGDWVVEYGLENLLSDQTVVPDKNPEDIRTAGKLCCLQLLIDYSLNLKGEKLASGKWQLTADNNDIDILKHLLTCTSLDKLIEGLIIFIVTLTGVDYYDYFQKRMKSDGFDLQETVASKSDPKLLKHIDLMIFFGLARFFVETLYWHFEIENLPVSKP